jgi:hypothetical protein
MKKTASILINKDNTPIKVREDNGEVVELFCSDFGASICVYPINMQRNVFGDVMTAKNMADAWDLAYKLFDDYHAGGIDFADNYALSKD